MQHGKKTYIAARDCEPKITLSPREYVSNKVDADLNLKVSNENISNTKILESPPLLSSPNKSEISDDDVFSTPLQQFKKKNILQVNVAGIKIIRKANGAPSRNVYSNDFKAAAVLALKRKLQNGLYKKNVAKQVASELNITSHSTLLNWLKIDESQDKRDTDPNPIQQEANVATIIEPTVEEAAPDDEIFHDAFSNDQEAEALLNET